jgi:hypothetical protein
MAGGMSRGEVAAAVPDSEETGKLVASSSESDSEKRTRAGGRERERSEGRGGEGREGGGRGGVHRVAAEGKRHWNMSVAAHGGHGHRIQPGTKPGEDMAATTAKARPPAFDMSLLDAEFCLEGAGEGGSAGGKAQGGKIGHRHMGGAEMGSSACSIVRGVGSTSASRRATRTRIAHFFEL